MKSLCLLQCPPFFTFIFLMLFFFLRHSPFLSISFLFFYFTLPFYLFLSIFFVRFYSNLPLVYFFPSFFFTSLSVFVFFFPSPFSFFNYEGRSSQNFTRRHNHRVTSFVARAGTNNINGAYNLAAPSGHYAGSL